MKTPETLLDLTQLRHTSRVKSEMPSNMECGGKTPLSPAGDSSSRGPSWAVAIHTATGLPRRPCGTPRNDEWIWSAVATAVAKAMAVKSTAAAGRDTALVFKQKHRHKRTQRTQKSLCAPCDPSRPVKPLILYPHPPKNAFLCDFATLRLPARDGCRSCVKPSLVRARQAAFSLVEVTLALGIAAFCLIAIFGLIPAGLKSNQTASRQVSANGILSMVTADLRATPSTTPPGGAATSQQFSIPIPANPVVASPTATTLYFSSDGQIKTTAAGSRYRVTATFLPNGSNARAATFVNLKASWPASIDPTGTIPPAGSVQTFIALDRN